MFILPRREREKTGFTFCLESEWAGGQKVDRSGNGLLQVWKRQIQQLNRVSPDMASAILSAYPSPRLLAQVKAVFIYEVPNRKYELCLPAYIIGRRINNILAYTVFYFVNNNFI